MNGKRNLDVTVVWLSAIIEKLLEKQKRGTGKAIQKSEAPSAKTIVRLNIICDRKKDSRSSVLVLRLLSQNLDVSL
jgi:hypothetical protein